jgi:TPR repeat protein
MLTTGAEIHTRLVAATSNQLWQSGRFFRHDVSLTPLAQAGQFKLTIDVDEAGDAPPVNQEFGAKEKALLQYRDWLAAWKSRAEDFVIAVNLTNSSLQGRGELVLSPSGLALAIRDPDPNGAGQLQYAVVASEKVMGFYSVWRKSKFLIPRVGQSGHILLQVRPPSPKSYGQGNIALMVKLGVPSEQPFRLEIELAPAVIASMASWMTTSLEDGVLTLSQTEDGNSQKLRVDATTGRLLQATVASDQTNGFVMAIRSEEGALARLFKEIAATTAEHPNHYTAKRGLASLVLFIARDAFAPQLTERVLSWFDDGSTPQESSEGAVVASRQIQTKLGLIREVLAQPNLDAALDPLKQLFAARPDEDATENFVVPVGESMAGSHANPMAAICAWVLHSSDSWFPRDSWPWVLLRESAFTVAGQPKYAEGELDKLMKSKSVGPVGYLATAYLLGRIDPKLARTFAQRGLTQLNLEDFHQDYRLLSRTNSISGDLAANALGLLGSLGQAQFEPLVAALAPDEIAFLHQSARLLRETSNQPKAEVVWPAIARSWDTIPRPALERGLNQFLPQAQFLTNSQALYNRGVELVSAKSAFQDFEEAAQCFRKAATQGHAGAQLGYGILCQDGQGVQQDFGEAMRWFRKAAEQKEPHARCRIAQLYQKGQGVLQDLDEAARWFRVEAEDDCDGAQFNLGLILEAKLDTDAAVKWYRRAAELGSIHAQAKLGNLLSDGFSVTPDYVEACQWLSLAAAAGDKVSELRLRRLKARLSIEQITDVEKRVTAARLYLDEFKKRQKNKQVMPGNKGE